MKLHELEKNIGATKAKKRVGRGPGSGLGKTSGRGQKGQKARSGGSINPVFEGGQLPLYKRLPKRGFSNKRFKKEYAIVNIESLNVFDDKTVVTPALLKEKGLITKEYNSGVKVLGDGELKKKLTIQANKFTKSALAKIEESGSKAEVI
ncbi:MAG: 50S ribosomal protein L15 [Bacilli bacterium]|nr:50S ribosomal protein L15 [Bacilli bacterium]